MRNPFFSFRHKEPATKDFIQLIEIIVDSHNDILKLERRISALEKVKKPRRVPHVKK